MPIIQLDFQNPLNASVQKGDVAYFVNASSVGVGAHTRNPTGPQSPPPPHETAARENIIKIGPITDIKDFDDFMKLARKSRDLYGNNFTYTLIDERAYNRTIKRRTLYVVGGVLVGIAGWSLIRATMDKSIIPKFN